MTIYIMRHDAWKTEQSIARQRLAKTRQSQ
jgi:hypothetical protein